MHTIPRYSGDVQKWKGLTTGLIVVIQKFFLKICLPVVKVVLVSKFV